MSWGHQSCIFNMCSLLVHFLFWLLNMSNNKIKMWLKRLQFQEMLHTHNAIQISYASFYFCETNPLTISAIIKTSENSSIYSSISLFYSIFFVIFRFKWFTHKFLPNKGKIDFAARRNSSTGMLPSVSKWRSIKLKQENIFTACLLYISCFYGESQLSRIMMLRSTLPNIYFL